jgi:hypothetical protein
MGSTSIRDRLARVASRARITLGPIGTAVGLAAAAVVWIVHPSLSLAIVVWAAVAPLSGRLLADALSRPDRARPALAHALFPVLLAVAFAAAVWVWGLGWSAAIAAIAVALGASAAIRAAWLAEEVLADEVEAARELERRRTDQVVASLGTSTVTEPSRPRLRV